MEEEWKGGKSLGTESEQIYTHRLVDRAAQVYQEVRQYDRAGAADPVVAVHQDATTGQPRAVNKLNRSR